MNYKGIGIAVVLALALIALAVPAGATVSTVTLTDPGKSMGTGNVGQAYFMYDPTVAGEPVSYTIEQGGEDIYGWGNWLAQGKIDHTARFNLSKDGKNYSTVKLTLTDLGDDVWFNTTGAFPGWSMTDPVRRVRYDFSFEWVDPDMRSFSGPTAFVGMVPSWGQSGYLYDNITWDQPYNAQAGLGIYSSINNTANLTSTIGGAWFLGGSWGTLLAKNGVYTFSHVGGPVTPPSGPNCSVAAEVVDFETGAFIGGAYLSAWSHDTIWNETTASFPYGAGEITIPISELSNTLEIEAIKSGYSTDGWIYPPGALTCDSVIRIYLTKSQVAGTDCDLTFGVYDWREHSEDNSTMLAIPGARVTITNGTSYSLTGVTNGAGTTTFKVNSTFVYNYTASATGYSPFISDVTCYGWSEYWETVFLTSGGIPTASPTTTPAAPHDTTWEALAFLKENALDLVVFFFVLTIIGGVKLINK